MKKAENISSSLSLLDAVSCVILSLASFDFFIFVLPNFDDKTDDDVFYVMRFILEPLLFLSIIFFYFIPVIDESRSKDAVSQANEAPQIKKCNKQNIKIVSGSLIRRSLSNNTETLFNFDKNQSSRESFKKLVSPMKADNNVSKLIPAVQARKQVFDATDAQIDELSENGIVEILIDCLNSPSNDLQYKAASALSHISAGTSAQIEAIVDADGIAILLELLDTADDEICEYVLTIIANIIAAKKCYLNECLDLGLIRIITKKVTAKNKVSNKCLQNSAKLIANICCYPLSIKVINKFFPCFKKLLRHSDPLVQEQVFLAFLNLTSQGNKHIQIIINNGFVKDMASILEKIVKNYHPASDTCIVSTTDNENLHIHALQTFCDIADGTAKQAQHLIDCGILSFIDKYLKSSNLKICREATNLIGNILSESEKQIQAVIDAKLIPILITLLDHEDSEIKNEAIWAFFNYTTCGSQSQIMPLTTDKTFIFLLTENLKNAENEIIEAILLILNFIFDKFEGNDLMFEFCQNLEDCGTIKKLEEFESNGNEEITNIVDTILQSLQTYTVVNLVQIGSTSKTAEIEDFVF